MNKSEIFSMIRRNGHSRAKAIRYISDFLQVDVHSAIQIYENEYLHSYLPNYNAQCPKFSPCALKSINEYKEAFKHKNLAHEVLEAYMRGLI